MEKQTITLADQEIQNRIVKHEHFLNDIEKVIDGIESIKSISQGKNKAPIRSR